MRFWYQKWGKSNILNEKMSAKTSSGSKWKDQTRFLKGWASRRAFFVSSIDFGEVQSQQLRSGHDIHVEPSVHELCKWSTNPFAHCIGNRVVRC